jgi:hypothetical protein
MVEQWTPWAVNPPIDARTLKWKTTTESDFTVTGNQRRVSNGLVRARIVCEDQAKL